MYVELPTASISELYFSNLESRYFGLGKINKDQLREYAHRKGVEIHEMEKWLSPNLGYDIEDV